MALCALALISTHHDVMVMVGNRMKLLSACCRFRHFVTRASFISRERSSTYTWQDSGGRLNDSTKRQINLAGKV